VLHVLMACDRVMEHWLREQVGPAYDALKANPSRAVTRKQVRARLATENEKASARRSSRTTLSLRQKPKSNWRCSIAL
jgi:hypothetical protein